MTAWFTIPAIVLLGFASGWFSGSGNRSAWFRPLRKPWFMPPGWVFPVMWTALYILMGLALAEVIDSQAPIRPAAIALFGLQLALNLAWSPLFFAAHRPRAALWLIVLLDLTLLATILAFAQVAPLPAWLLAPYALWLALATALNAAIVRLNR